MGNYQLLRKLKSLLSKEFHYISKQRDLYIYYSLIQAAFPIIFEWLFHFFSLNFSASKLGHFLQQDKNCLSRNEPD